jgi:hypothetical protein
MAAVRQKWSALRYASDELQNDREVVMTALNWGGYGERYASRELQNDYEMSKTNWSALKYASDELKSELKKELRND